ncbi:MAG: GNAT family N-acetyltransferase [Candidatus Methylomirabilia bacterium]
MQRQPSGTIDAAYRDRWGLPQSSAARRLAGRVARRCGVQFFDFIHADIACERFRLVGAHPSRGVEAAPAAPADFETLLGALPAALAGHARQHLVPGCTCYLAKRDGEPAGFSFLSRSHRVVFGLEREPLPVATAYHFFGLVFLEHRRQGVYSTLLQAMAADLGREGFARLTSLVRRNNLPSLAAHRRSGARLESRRILKLPGIRALHFGARADGGVR